MEAGFESEGNSLTRLKTNQRRPTTIVVSCDEERPNQGNEGSPSMQPRSYNSTRNTAAYECVTK